MIKQPLLVLALACAVTACSDGGGSSPVDEVVNANPAGIWRGCLTTLLANERVEPGNQDFSCGDPLKAGQHELFMIADKDGHMRVASEMSVLESVESGGLGGTPFLARGQLKKIEENEVSGYLDVYSKNPESLTPKDESIESRYMTVTGEVATRDYWTADVKFNELVLYKFEAYFDETETQKGATPETLSGIGTFVDGTRTLTFLNDGTFAGTDTIEGTPCTYKGTYFVPDPAYNIYQFAMVIENNYAANCNSLKDTYGGVGALVEENGIPVLRMIMKTEKRILQFKLTH